jgi:hypothetical protein
MMSNVLKDYAPHFPDLTVFKASSSSYGLSKRVGPLIIYAHIYFKRSMGMYELLSGCHNLCDNELRGFSITLHHNWRGMAYTHFKEEQMKYSEYFYKVLLPDYLTIFPDAPKNYEDWLNKRTKGYLFSHDNNYLDLIETLNDETNVPLHGKEMTLDEIRDLYDRYLSGGGGESISIIDPIIIAGWAGRQDKVLEYEKWLISKLPQYKNVDEIVNNHYQSTGSEYPKIALECARNNPQKLREMSHNKVKEEKLDKVVYYKIVDSYYNDI